MCQGLPLVIESVIIDMDLLEMFFDRCHCSNGHCSCVFVFRFILRVLPAEVSCYASIDEITREIKPLIAQYFPEETENPQKVCS